MPQPTVPQRRLIEATGLLLLPVFVVLAGFVAFGGLPWGLALLGLVLIAIVLALILRFALIDLESVRGFLETLGHDVEPTPPDLNWRAAAELVAAADRLGAATREARARLVTQARAGRRLLDGFPEPVVLIDAEHRVMAANKAAHNLFGRKPARRDLATIVRDPTVLETARAVLLDGRGRDVEFTLSVPVERFMCARVRRLRAPLADGSIAVITLADLTEAKRGEQMRADFIANASHELHTPLSALIGYIETLRESAKQDPKARERFLGIMHDQATRMSRLVHDLMSLSRIELHEHTLPKERVDLGAVLGAVAETLQLKAKARKIAIEIELPAAPPFVLGDADELEQVFQNLVDNAIKYGRAKTPIRVQVTLGEDGGGERWVSVAVRDRGEGMAPEHLPRLTERFYRVDDARSRELGGTGLGLAIVKHIVSRHRGTFSIDSKLGKGSTFTVRLPLAP